MDRWQRNYAECLKDGEEFQQFVHERLCELGFPIINHRTRRSQLRGENTNGVEIKHDRKWRQTGNLYMETAEKSHPSRHQYVSSGIYRGDNSWIYIVGDYDRFFIFSIERLRDLHRSGGYRFVVRPTTQGFLLPMKDAERFAMRIVETRFREDGTVQREFDFK